MIPGIDLRIGEKTGGDVSSVLHGRSECQGPGTFIPEFEGVVCARGHLSFELPNPNKTYRLTYCYFILQEPGHALVE